MADRAGRRGVALSRSPRAAGEAHPIGKLPRTMALACGGGGAFDPSQSTLLSLSGWKTDGLPNSVAQRHQAPVFGIDAQGSAGASAGPFWRSSIEIKSGVRMKAMRPSRGGRLMVTPASMSLLQVA